MPIGSLTSPLVPSKERSVTSSVTFSAPIPTTPPGEKWFVDVNVNSNRNYGTEAVELTIYDIRGQEEQTHIDTTGFQGFTSPSSIPAELLLSGDDKKIEEIYYPEVEALILKHTEASRVVFFDHTVRKPKGNLAISDPSERKPVLLAHVDQTPASSHK